MRRSFWLALLASALFMSIAGAADASYLGRGAAKSDATPAAIHSTTLSSVLAELTSIQKGFRERMSRLARRIDDAPSVTTVLVFLALCCAYGTVHAAGPGHGKAVVSAYFVARGGDLRRALLFGNLLAFAHVGLAVVLILGMFLFFTSWSIFSFNAVSEKLYPLSYLLIALVGLGMLVKTARDSRGRRRSSEENPEEPDTRGMFALAVAAGIVPCPGAALILLFTINLDLLWLGLLGMIALAVGMGITTTAAACLSLGLRKTLSRAGARFSKGLKPAYVVVSIVGACFITLFGLLMFLSSLSQGAA